MSRIFKRKEGVMPYIASTQSRLPLSRNYHMRNLIIKLTVNHTNSSANFNNNLYGLINTLQIVGNGSENIKQIPFSKLKVNSLKYYGQEVEKITKSDGTFTSHIYAMVNFEMPETVRPHDTILNTALFKTFDILVDWGSDNTIGSGITVNSASVTVHSESLVNYIRNKAETVKYFKETSLSEEITSSSNDKTIVLAPQKLYKAITIVSTVANKLNDDVIDRIILKSGTTVFADIDAEALRADNILTYRPTSQDDLKGVYIIELTKRNRLSDLLDTIKSFNTLELVLSVTKQSGTNTVTVLSDTIEETQIVENP